MYNTVLGAKPMHADGRAFYYADYNYAGKKVYSNHGFPCCSGTLPQVAVDYRVNTYFRDPTGIYVNLYMPSSVRWTYDGAEISLRQDGIYPFEDSVSLEIGTSQPKEFALRLRIPEWAQDARVEVNGKKWQDAAEPGTFLAIFRQWRSGDRIDLQMPRKMRLQAIDPQHPDTVALLCGPLVLFAITKDSAQPFSIARAKLLAARQTEKQAWEVTEANGPIRLLPYIGIDDEQYSTYLHVT
jgi:hypothetical protein